MMVYMYFNPRYREVATSILLSGCSLYGFQSTLPRGSDVFYLAYITSICAFQSTLPRGSDIDKRVNICNDGYFNPRYREVATYNPPKNPNAAVFQSTLPRGSDPVRTTYSV